MTQVTYWWWIRHAPVTANNGRIYGQGDPPADADDPVAAQALARALPDGAVLVTSHLQRTHQTANAIRAGGLEMPDPVVEKDLAEQNLGDWQGKVGDEIVAEMGTHNFWMAPARHEPPNGESFASMTGRVSAVIERLNGRYAGCNIIAVTHGGTIRAALGHALNLDPDLALAFHIDNWSITRVEHHAPTESHPDGSWAVRGVNVHAPGY